MGKREDKQKILDNLYSQISSFDNKANIFITVIGIMFALSLTFLNIFGDDRFVNAKNGVKLYYNICFILFVINIIFSLFAFIMTIVPRKNNCIEINANYYKHIAKMDINELTKEINDYIKDEEQIINQIKINGNICNKKHNWVMIGMISLCPCIVCFFNLIIIIRLIL